MAQEENVASIIHEKYKWLDLVFGTHNIHKLPILLDELIKTKNKILMYIASKVISMKTSQ